MSSSTIWISSSSASTSSLSSMYVPVEFESVIALSHTAPQQCLQDATHRRPCFLQEQTCELQGLFLTILHLQLMTFKTSSGAGLRSVANGARTPFSAFFRIYVQFH